jgi:hypothetical protein
VTETNEWAWCYRYVEYCAGDGIMQGYADDIYRPANAVTRDQMAVYVARAFQLPMCIAHPRPHSARRGQCEVRYPPLPRSLAMAREGLAGGARAGSRQPGQWSGPPPSLR